MESTSDNKDFNEEEMNRLIENLPNIICELEKEIESSKINAK